MSRFLCLELICRQDSANSGFKVKDNFNPEKQKAGVAANLHELGEDMEAETGHIQDTVSRQRRTQRCRLIYRY